MQSYEHILMTFWRGVAKNEVIRLWWYKLTVRWVHKSSERSGCL